MVNYLAQEGFLMEPATKGKGSIKEGISFLQDRPVIVHSRCENTFREFTNLRWKRHNLTKTLIDEIVDRDNHCVDAVRYSLEGAALGQVLVA